MAVTFIIIGMILDFLDGMLARALDVASEFGKELDSLSDLVTFGIAPSILSWVIFSSESYLIGVGVLMFPITAAYRLARFNVKDNNSKSFSGVPITITGGLLALISLYGEYISLPIFFWCIITLSISMVSRFSFLSLKGIMTVKKLKKLCSSFLTFINKI